MPNLEQGLAKLSKLFDGSPSEIMSNAMPGFNEYDELVIDESDGLSFIGVASEEEFIDVDDYDDAADPFATYDPVDFNKFISAFISQVQAVYSSYGISLNNKHIEVLLSQMINEVIIVNGGQSDYKIGDKLT